MVKVVITSDNASWEFHEFFVDYVNDKHGLRESGHNGGGGYYYTDGENNYEHIDKICEDYIFENMVIMVRSYETDEEKDEEKEETPDVYKFKLEKVN